MVTQKAWALLEYNRTSVCRKFGQGVLLKDHFLLDLIVFGCTATFPPQIRTGAGTKSYQLPRPPLDPIAYFGPA